MHLVFLGGTRFIGHAACVAALGAGHRVTVVHRGRHAAQIPFASEVFADRADPSSFAVTVAKAKPDVVIDMRAMTKVDAQTAALAIKTLGVPAVVISSQDVYAQFGKLNGLPAPATDEERVGEDSPRTIARPFAKLGAHEGGADYDKKDVETVYEELARETGEPVAALRLPVVYGPRDPKRRFGAVVDALDAGQTYFDVAGGAPLRLSHVHVADAAHAIVLAATRAPSGFRAFNVAEAETPAMGERALALAAFLKRPLSLREQDEDDVGLFGHYATHCVLDTARIRDELGYRETLGEDERLGSLVAALRATRGMIDAPRATRGIGPSR